MPPRSRASLAVAAALTLGAPLATLTTASATLPAVNSIGTPSQVTAAAPGVERTERAEHRARRAAPTLRVSTKVSGLDHAWDVKPIDGKRLLITERDPAQLTIARPTGTTYAVDFPSSTIWTSGETGLMGLEIDPRFSSNGRFYTCSGWVKRGGGHDIRVNAWRLDDARRKATLVKPLLTGLPTSSGRHGGCRLLLTSDGSLLVGTGDAAIGTNPRNLRSLGGKTLRLDRSSGKPWPDNPFVKAGNRDKRYVYTYGHRNVQGLAERRDGSLWSAEHGPDVDDEINKLVAGGDYGWNPVPGYNESVPMTDQALPGTQVEARFSTGDPTLATSGSTFVYGKKWGSLNGALAVATLKAERLIFLTFDKAGRNPRVTAPASLNQDGRLRSVTQLRNGNLLVPTDGIDGQGKILLVRPR